MKKLMYVVVVCFSLLFFSANVFPAYGGNYFVAKAGVYSPQSDDLEDFNDGFSGELAIGHYINPLLAVEFGVGYIGTDASESGFDYDLGNYDMDIDLYAVPVTGTLKAFVPLGIGVEAYGGVGGGVYFVEGDLDAFSSYLGPASTDDEDTTFGWHVVAGLNIDLTPFVFLGVEGRYLWAKANFSKYGDDLDVDLNGYTVMGTLGVRF